MGMLQTRMNHLMCSENAATAALMAWAKAKGISVESDVIVKNFEHGGRGLAAGI
jgi:hypothetical protein